MHDFIILNPDQEAPVRRSTSSDTAGEPALITSGKYAGQYAVGSEVLSDSVIASILPILTTDLQFDWSFIDLIAIINLLKLNRYRNFTRDQLFISTMKTYTSAFLGVTLPMVQLDSDRMFKFSAILIAVMSTICFLFLIPPFQSPDELQHFYRSYALAQGVVVADRHGNDTGSLIPTSLPATVEHFLGTPLLHTDRPLIKLKDSDRAAESVRPLKPDKVDFVTYPDAALIGPVGYLPQAIGIRIASISNASPLQMLYAGRASNALVALILMSIGLLAARSGVALFGCIILLPMTGALLASLSPDALLISLSGLFVGLMLSKEKAEPDRILIIVLSVLGGAILSIKITYIALVAFGGFYVAWRARQIGQFRNGVIAGATIVGLSLFVGLIWIKTASPIVVTSRPLTNPSLSIDAANQVMFILNNPIEYCSILFGSMAHHFTFYVKSAIGVLGWLSVPIGLPAYVAAVIAIVIAISGNKSTILSSEGFKTPSSVAFLAVILTWILLETSLYIRWTPVGATLIEGVQGRYFLPALFLLAFVPISVPVWSGRISRYQGISVLVLMSSCLIFAFFSLRFAFHEV